MKRFSVAALVLSVAVLIQSHRSYAFKTGYHFYLTYAVAHWCGLDDFPAATGNAGDASEAYAIAWADFSTDTFAETDAGARPDEWLDPTKAETRRIFHFAVPAGAFNRRVKRGSGDAWQTTEAGISAVATGATDPHATLFLGLGLHTLQDSWSHEGFSPQWGHWTQDPDFPDTDVTKSLEAAQATWDALNRWKIKAHGKGCNVAFNDISGLVEVWSGKPLHSGQEISDYWRKNIEALAQKPVPTNRFDDNETWSKAFLTAADQVTKLKQRDF